MKNITWRLCALLLVCSIIFMAGIQVPPALSSPDSQVELEPNASTTDREQMVLVIPGEGYFIRQPGETRPLHGELSDPFGQKIQEMLKNDWRDKSPATVSMPTSEYLVTNSLDSGEGSLRWAIDQANTNPGPDVIRFHTIYMSNKTISPGTNLPAIVDSDTTIDATLNWSGSWPGGKPGITIDGSSISGTSYGLSISGANNVTIKGLAVENFNNCIWISGGSYTTIGEGASTLGGGRMIIRNCNGPAVYIYSGHHNRVIGSYIGISDAGNLPVANLGDGVTILDSQRNSIGGEGPLEGNIIGASDYGVRILGSLAISNTVVENQIGVGMLNSNIANVHDGVYIEEAATYNAIGGRITIFPRYIMYECLLNGNDIRNNGGNGITLSDSGSAYNGIMTNYVDNNQSNGIEVANKASGAFIGCNTIVGNDQSGMYLHQADTWGHWIRRNFIGTDENYTSGLGNALHGIGLYDGTRQNTIDSNTIVNNGWSGVAIVGIDTTKNWLLENHIGVGKNGESMGNAFFGVDIVESPSNPLTLNEIAYNGSAGNLPGVHIAEDTAVGNGLFMNSIYENAGLGIDLTGRSQHEIGTPVINSVDCPVVSGIAGPVGARVDIFSDNADEGRYYEGKTTVNENYQWSFFGRWHGPNLTAIVIDMVTYDSSEFSAPAMGAGSCYIFYLPIVNN